MMTERCNGSPEEFACGACLSLVIGLRFQTNFSVLVKGRTDGGIGQAEHFGAHGTAGASATGIIRHTLDSPIQRRHVSTASSEASVSERARLEAPSTSQSRQPGRLVGGRRTFLNYQS